MTRKPCLKSLQTFENNNKQPTTNNTFVFVFYNKRLCSITLNIKILKILSPNMFNDPHFTNKLAIKANYSKYNLKYLNMFFNHAKFYEFYSPKLNMILFFFFWLIKTFLFFFF